jgi:polyisoprenoid-binding protein YceI
MTVTTAQTQRYAIDPAHSYVEFIVRHMMLAKVRGVFAALSGALEIPAGSDVPSAVNVTIETSSIDTREERRDGHLRSADFLDVAQYPQITFVSSRISGEAAAFKVQGNLTIHGVTREVTLDATFGGRGTDPRGNQRVGYDASTKISRKDFGLTWNVPLESGGVLVGDDVRIELSVEAIPQK